MYIHWESIHTHSQCKIYIQQKGEKERKEMILINSSDQIQQLKFIIFLVHSKSGTGYFLSWLNKLNFNNVPAIHFVNRIIKK